ncbi:M1 family aminopeptidase, partial [Gemmatimonas sp.]|uniref:M1 family aminopeptidase n=1 Tax=Gemmatimonas sp. TaxID=1962908 RepID=UPI002869F3B6
YLASVLLVAFVPFATVATGFGPAASAINGPYIVMETVGILTLVSVFALPMLCIAAAGRDDEYRMRELINSSPVRRGVLLGARCAGVLLAALAVVALALVVQAVSPFVLSVRAERVVDFNAASYLSAFFMLAVPNTLFCGALLYLVAAASRSTLATFVASIAIYAGYAVTAMMVDSPLMAGTRPPTPELLARTALLDPFGLSAFFEQTRYWTPLERNTRLVTLSGHMLWNRLLVLGLSALCLMPLSWLDRRAPRPRRMRSTHVSRVSIDPPILGAPPARLTPVVPSTNVRHTLWHATGSAGALELRLLLRSWPLRALLVLWVSMIAIEADGQLAGGEYGTRLLASSAVLADAVPIGLWLIGTLCALYFAADAVARERIIRFDGIRDATPVANLALLLGKLGALLLIPVLLTTAGYGAAMVVHALAGGLPIEPRVYAAHMLMSLVPLWITTVLAVAWQVLTGNRWLGLFTGLVLAFIAEDGENVGLEHLITRFGASPALRWSDLDGFGSAWPSWMAFNALWALGSLTLIGAAAALWPRGLAVSFRERVRALPRRLSSGLTTQGRRALLGTTGAFIVAYAFMARETVWAAQWESRDQTLDWRADYELRYRRLQSVAQPQIVDVALDVALEPEARRAVVRGNILVENRTARAIDTLWVMMPRDVRDATVAIAGAPPVTPDGRFGVQAIALPAPLDSGARISLAYALTLDRSGLRADGFNEDIAGNGTFVRSNAVVPSIGYQGRYEIADSTARALRGLGLATPMLAAGAQARGLAPAWFTVRTTLSTDLDQTALGPGELVKSWTANGRRHFSYQLTRPSTPMFAVSSGRYAVERRTVGGVTVELWYHAAHGVQAARIVDIAARSLMLLQQQFGAYPHNTLRLIEVPASWGFGAYAQTGSIYLTESRGMLSDARDGDVDLLVRRIGHEVAHQWWGHTVDPLWSEGRLTIVETLAKYSEQLLLGKHQGDAVLARMMSFDHDRYLSGSANTIGLEPTLLTTADESHLYYGKGALAFHALREVLGDSAINAALRTLLARDSGPRGAATATGLYTLLHEAARDDEARAAVHEWFAERVIYDLSADSAMMERRGGTARVFARFRVQRVRSDSAGEHVEPAEGAAVTVGIYGGPPDKPQLLLRRRQRVTNGEIVLDATVVGIPVFVEIDPEIRLIDRDRTNNRIRLSLVAEDQAGA